MRVPTGEIWMRPRVHAWACLQFLLVAWGCGSDNPSQEVTVPGAADTPRSERMPVASQPVVGYVGPDGQPFEVTLRTPGATSSVHRTIGTRTFELSLRGRPLAQYPCTSCHAGPLVTSARPEDAHQDIQPTHPSEFGGECGVCHSRQDVHELRLQGGTVVPLDEAYRLCGQCHYAATEAWASGGHGKRLDGWSGTRVVMGCTDCHEPHEPEVPKRIPFRGPTLPPGVDHGPQPTGGTGGP